MFVVCASVRQHYLFAHTTNSFRITQRALLSSALPSPTYISISYYIVCSHLNSVCCTYACVCGSVWFQLSIETVRYTAVVPKQQARKKKHIVLLLNTRNSCELSDTLVENILSSLENWRKREIKREKQKTFVFCE